VELQDRQVVLTGGSGAVGSAVAARVIAAGATLIVADRVPPAAALLDALGDGAARLTFRQTDVTDEASVRSLFAAAARSGGPQVLLNVAGGFRFGPAVEDTSVVDWDSMLDLNLRSAFLCIKHALPLMKAANYGRIVSVAARAGLQGSAMIAPYAVSKGGVILLTQAAADEVNDLDITINAVLPSVIDTDANRGAMPDADFDAWVSPDDLAEVILFLASDRARSIRGAAIPVYYRA